LHVFAKRNDVNNGNTNTNRNKGKPVQTIGGLTGKFKRMCEVYRIFSKHWEHMLDFSDQALIELFNHESYGTPISEHNGYALGKKWLNVHVTIWKEDIRDGFLFKKELYDDPKFPHWWLDSIFK
jgi:hypothetical protein